VDFSGAAATVNDDKVAPDSAMPQGELSELVAEGYEALPGGPIGLVAISFNEPITGFFYGEV